MAHKKSNRKEQRQELQKSWVIVSSAAQSHKDAMPYNQAVAIVAANMKLARERAFTEEVRSGS